MTDVWLAATSGAQYSGDELMKFRGDDVRTPGVWLEVVEATGGVRVDGARTGFAPLVITVEASGTCFRGKLVS